MFSGYAKENRFQTESLNNGCFLPVFPRSFSWRVDGEEDGKEESEDRVEMK